MKIGILTQMMSDFLTRDIFPELPPDYVQPHASLPRRIKIPRGAENEIMFEPFKQDELVYSIPKNKPGTTGATKYSIYKKTTIDRNPIRKGTHVWNPTTSYIPKNYGLNEANLLGYANLSNAPNSNMTGGRKVRTRKTRVRKTHARKTRR